VSGNHPPAPGQARAGQITAPLWLAWISVGFGLLSGRVKGYRLRPLPRHTVPSAPGESVTAPAG